MMPYKFKVAQCQQEYIWQCYTYMVTMEMHKIISDIYGYQGDACNKLVIAWASFMCAYAIHTVAM